MSQGLTNSIFNDEIYSIKSRPVIVLDRTWNNIKEEEKALLERIIHVAKISLNDVDIIASQSLEILQRADRPPIAIAFGLDVPGLPQNEILDVQGTRTILTSDLRALADADKESKQKLARALSELF